MNETNRIEFSNNELLKILLRQQGITEGHWVLAALFKLGATNLGQNPDGSDALPSGVVSLAGVSIEKTPEPLPFSVNAAEL